MKRYTLTILLIFTCIICQAQMGSILKSLGQQIAELKIYAALLEKGYNIAQTGLTTIHQLKKGEFDLHSGYFTSLKTVKGSLKDLGSVTETISLQITILKHCNEGISFASSSKYLRPQDAAFAINLYRATIKESVKTVGILLDVLTDNVFQMTDGDRITALQMIHDDVFKQYGVVLDYRMKTESLSYMRAHDQNEIVNLKSLYGL